MSRHLVRAWSEASPSLPVGKYGLSGAQCRAHEGTREAVAKLAQPVARRVTGAVPPPYYREREREPGGS